MKASVVDLRYRMSDILKALARNEDVLILHRGKEKGVLRAQAQAMGALSVEDHPFFNLRPEIESVEDEMDRLRGGRCRDL